MSRRTKSTSGSVLELVLIIAVALGLALGIQAFLVKPYRIPSGSMLPTLAIGQRVLVNRIGHVFTHPSVGDILVFHPPAAAEGADILDACGNPQQPENGEPCAQPIPRESSVNFIKRVVGLPGDRIAIRDGHVYRNGAREKDGYIRPCDTAGIDCNLPQPITVPPGHYFMMGDNRGSSDDSRFWGPVPDDWIIGKAVATYWPLNRVGIF